MPWSSFFKPWKLKHYSLNVFNKNNIMIRYSLSNFKNWYFSGHNICLKFYIYSFASRFYMVTWDLMHWTVCMTKRIWCPWVCPWITSTSHLGLNREKQVSRWHFYFCLLTWWNNWWSSNIVINNAYISYFLFESYC